MRKKHIKAVDLFCGAGGSSSGLAQACAELGLGLRLLAINHWDIAIDTHSANHPDAKHMLTGLDAVDPRKAVPGGKLDLLVASPECQHHSIARGGKPINDQSRTSAWLVLRWCEALHVQNVLIENVKEFQGWGPIGANGRLLKRRKGEIFNAFVNALRSLGYTVDHRVLNAADFGDPTSRERLFIIARRGRKPIAWPEPTHAPQAVLKMRATATLLRTHAEMKPHRTAREIIDWSIEGESIFNRKRPLSPNTMNRIFAGLRKYCGLSFIVPNFGERAGQEPRTHAVDAPLPVVTGHGAGALCEPFIVKFNAGQDAEALDAPLSALMTKDHHGLCEPFLVTLRTHADADSLDGPLKTVCAGGQHHALCQPFLIPQHNDRTRSIDRPLQTLTTESRGVGLCQAFVLGQQSQGAPRDVDRPLPTIATDGAIALIEPFLTAFRGNHNGRHDGDQRNHKVDAPLPTLDTSNRYALVEPFVMNITHSMNPQRNIQSVDAPLAAVLTKQEHALVQPFIVPVNHGAGDTRSHDVDRPMPTVTAFDALGLIQPYLVKFYGTGQAASIDAPLDSVTTKDRFGLCIPQISAVLDIRFRMLQPHELAAAMGFPKTYIFKGNREQRVRQIGNAVAVKTAQALCATLLL